jgi:hypothetical protein
MKKLLAAGVTLSTVLSLCLITDPAWAAAPRTVWVDVRANGAWPVRQAAAYVDRYTGTTMRFGACRKGSPCVRIRENGDMPRLWAAVTYVGTNPTNIQLNPGRRRSSYTQRLDTIVHELGHAFGIYTHNSSCGSVMYYSLACPNGRDSTLNFSASERTTLRRH